MGWASARRLFSAAMGESAGVDGACAEATLAAARAVVAFSKVRRVSMVVSIVTFAFSVIRAQLKLKQEVHMARIRGVEANEAGLFTRFVYWMTRRKIGRVVLPLKITAHLPRLLAAVGGMEMAEQAAGTVDAKLKALASIKTATLVGCPF
jgi:hypothetical protein